MSFVPVTGVAFDDAGNLYTTDSLFGRVFQIGPDGQTVKPFATGVGGQPGFIAFGSVPEPSTLVLALTGFVGLIGLLRSKI